MHNSYPTPRKKSFSDKLQPVNIPSSQPPIPPLTEKPPISTSTPSPSKQKTTYV
ncbi:hypothetical protein DM02DRAFT_618928 [Periconia macrospinosa]|uniref:Uncharacterized protein n=1 Tax=Periconia macrospinosa TaxID=97972 RepID=A0A2V1D9X5_9PLEO|nr:hypothetical protein DM02DRAFT_618928 [Periconia macrospinosa]